MVTHAKLTPAMALAAAIDAAGLTAEPAESHMAVRVTRPGNGATTTVWLPLAEYAGELGEGYIWGPSFQYTAPSALPIENVARLVTATAVHW